MDFLDNVTKTVRDDLAVEIKHGSKMSIAAASFSIYAFEELKKELMDIDELRFIFTSPTFLREKEQKTRREFYIPRLSRERNLYGTEFEIKLRNELTQRAIAKECAEWVRQKVKFKSNVTQEQVPGFIVVDDYTYMPIQGFTTVDLGCDRGNNAFSFITKTSAYENSSQLISAFEELWRDNKKLEDVTSTVLESISTAYKENSPDFIYFYTLYNIFNEFLDNISEDVLPNEANGFKQSKIWNLLYDFQKDAALAIINKLEKYNGCILADSVGLGKTFTALAVIKYYENRNKSVLVLCPKKLSENWNTYKANYVNNPIADDRLHYTVLYHTDLSRTHGHSNGVNLEMLNWGNFDLVVIDESHNFRNGGEISGEDDRENRYLRLLKQVVRAGVPTKVLMLSATPVNNKFIDLKNQLALAYEGDASKINEKLNTTKSIDEIFRSAQKEFNAWSKLPVEQRTTDRLLKALDFDFFEVLDSVTIARSRRHIEKYYSTSEIGKFPERKKPISLQPPLTDIDKAINYNEIYQMLMSLNLHIYTPSDYILPSKLPKYMDLTHNQGDRLTQRGREQGIRRLMSINLLKRLESSVYAFSLTVERIYKLIDETITAINNYESGNYTLELRDMTSIGDVDDDDIPADFFSVGKKVRIDLADMNYVSWKRDLEHDAEYLRLLSMMINDITPEHDTKLQTLFNVISEKIHNPLNAGNKKILIFSAFSDTADYLYENVSKFAKDTFGLHTAEITGNVEGRSTIPKLRCDLNNVLTCFSPVSKGREYLKLECTEEVDILVATDCISEGQNLQDCDFCINYDIHWNPVRIIQRFGRIDRIGSKNDYIQLVNFWPDMTLDEYINLKGRVETRMKITVMTSTGDDDLINAEEKGDLEYRSQQLRRLKDEVVDIEEMSGGISIMDLGLNEFRLDLLEYMKHNDDVEHTPHGMHAVVGADSDTVPGTVFVLRNVNDSVNVDSRNRIHPFYMVYISNKGEVVCDYLDPKKMLDTLRHLCKGKTEPAHALCHMFNALTDDGKSMETVSFLLDKAVRSIVDVKADSDIDSLFKSGGTSALLSDISGLDDFELICFLVVM